MHVERITDEELRKHIYDNKAVIVKFDPRTEYPECAQFEPVFERMAGQPEFRDICFFTTYSDSNPTAHKLILEQRKPFVVLYKNGLVVGSGLVCTEEELRDMLMLSYQTKINI